MRSRKRGQASAGVLPSFHLICRSSKSGELGGQFVEEIGELFRLDEFAAVLLGPGGEGGELVGVGGGIGKLHVPVEDHELGPRLAKRF